ncbi:hypothetical protein [Desulfobacter curvatus]|uniref:hypothetical protein n=1 Tax=Desulfobacter curvatus TaxID=2290 RepID=UPI000370FAE5|nr:hypothetical protein [Desulfobacter curvatus]
MYAQGNKSKGNKSRVVANSVDREKSNVKQGFGFVDSRPEYIKQRKLQKGFESTKQQENSLRSLSTLIQRKEIEVSGGKFDTYTYEAINGFKKGAEIALFFQGNDELGDDDDTVSLVQTVNDTTKLTHSTTNEDITPTPTTSELGNRVLTEDDEYAVSQDIGTGIDQEVLNDQGGVNNLDPRYSETRMDENEELNIQGKTSHPYSVKSGKKVSGKWTKAQLNDEPGLNTRIRRVEHTLTGGMKFEVAALHNDTGQYLGSIRWGWEMNTGTPELTPADIERVDFGSASKTFHRAAKKWNETKILDQLSSTSHVPIQLPVDETKLATHFALDKIVTLDLGNLITNQTGIIVSAVENGGMPKLKTLIIHVLSMTPELRGRLIECGVNVILNK